MISEARRALDRALHSGGHHRYAEEGDGGSYVFDNEQVLVNARDLRDYLAETAVDMGALKRSISAS